MIPATRELSLSIRSSMSFRPCLASLKQALNDEGFRIIAEVPFHREVEIQTGLSWRNYVVLIVWSPQHAYQALLSDRDAGIFMPFHVVLAENDSATLISATNHLAFSRMAGTIGIQVLARELDRKIRHVFHSLSVHESRRPVAVLTGTGKEAS